MSKLRTASLAPLLLATVHVACSDASSEGDDTTTASGPTSGSVTTGGEGGNGEGGNGDGGASTASTGSTSSTGGGGEGGAPDTSDYTWKRLDLPCAGGNLVGLVPDGATRLIAACGGLNTFTEGIHVSNDGGETWAQQARFEQWKPGRLRRERDGVFYIPGFGAEGEPLFGIDASLANNLAPTVLIGSLPGLGVATNMARTNDGKIMVVNGSSVAILQLPGEEAVFERTLHEDAIDDEDTDSEVRVVGLRAIGNEFYAVGGKREGNAYGPAEVYVPTARATSRFRFAAVELQNASDSGELTDLHVWSPTRMVAGGWDDTFGDPLVYVCNGDPSLRASWQQIDPQTFEIPIPTAIAGVNAVASSGDRVLLAGGYLSYGFIVESNDFGATWTNVTDEISPDGMDYLFDAGSLDAGRMYVATSTELYLFGP